MQSGFPKTMIPITQLLQEQTQEFDVEKMMTLWQSLGVMLCLPFREVIIFVVISTYEVEHFIRGILCGL